MFRITAATASITTLPPAKDLEQLIEQYPGFHRAGLADSEFVVRAFSKNPITGRYVTQLENGYMLETMTMRRIVHKQAIERETSIEVEKKEAELDRELGMEEVQTIKDQVMLAHTPNMLVDEKHCKIIYHSGSGLTFFCSATPAVVRDADLTLKSLFKETAHVKPITKGQKEAITSCLSKYIQQGDDSDTEAFGEYFSLDDFVVLKEPSSNGQKGGQITVKDISIPPGHDCHGLLSCIHRSDAKVVKIGLQYLDQLTFTLQPNLVLSSIKSVISDQEDEQADTKDPSEQYIADAAALLELLTDLYKQLADLLGHVMPEPPALSVLKSSDAPEPEHDNQGE